MALPSSKIAPFPGLDPRSVPPEAKASESADPTRELRSYIQGLQDEARQAKLQQEALEEDRDRLAEEVRRLQRESDLLAQAKKEIRDLTVERDRLLSDQEKQQALAIELRRKADGSDRMRSQLEAQRDEAMRLYKDLRRETDQHVAARDEAIRQRDAALRQRAQAVRQQEEAVTRFAEAQRQLAEAQRAALEAQSGASRKSEADVQKQISALRQARDNAAAQALELKSRVVELEDQLASLAYDRDVSDQTTKKVLLELDELRIRADADAEKAQSMAALQAELSEVAGELKSLREQHAAVQGAKEQLVSQLREFRETHEAMLVSNTSQFESTAKERDLLRTRLQERETELAEVRAELAAAWAGAMQVTEPEIQRLNSELEQMRARAAEVEGMTTRHEEVTREREEMRLQVIELNAQLENARREIKEVGAALAEARLQLKLAGKSSGLPGSARRSGAENGGTEAGSADRIAGMMGALQTWTNNPHEVSAGWELAKQVTAIAGSSEVVGQRLLHRVSATLARFVERLTEKIQPPTAGNFRTLKQMVALVAAMHDDHSFDDTVRLTGARVHVVDDDVGACKAVSQVLQAAGFIADCSNHPSGALAQLASNSYDLLIFDVRLPEIDGLQLYGYARGLDQHAATPVLFMSGAEDVAPQDLPGAELIAKPFDSVELTLHAMRLIIQPQLARA